MTRASALPTPHLQVQALNKFYQGPQSVLHALRDIDLRIQHGEVFGIIGRSGAGKSTLLRVFNRLEQPSNGRVLINGEDINRFNPTRLRALRRRVAMIFQHFNLHAAKTVEQNIALPLHMAGVDKTVQGQRVGELLTLIGLEDKRLCYPNQLSGGQKQRVGIARALALQPEILLCDEATSALDPESTQSVLTLLRDINQRLGLTIILITHEMSVIRDICDRVAVLERGELVEQGEVWQVFGQPRHSVTQSLLQTLEHNPGLYPQPSAHTCKTLTLRFTGERREPPSLSRLHQLLGREIQLQQALLEPIGGRSVGRLVIGFQANDHELPSIRQQLLQLADHVDWLPPADTLPQSAAG